MSSTILYNRCFIKATDKEGQDYIVPMIQAGASNCTQTSRKGREIHERSWEGLTYYTNGKMFATPEEIMKGVDQERVRRIEQAEANVKKYDETWAYDDKSFGYHAGVFLYGYRRSTTFASYRAFFAGGIKRAVTVEELRQNNVSVCLYVSTYSKEQIEKKGLEIKPTVYPKTSEELLEKAKEYEEYYGNLNCCYISCDDFEMEFYFERKKRANKINRQNTRVNKKTEVEFYFVFKCEVGFLVRLTKHGFKYSFNDKSYSTKKVKTESEAKTYLKKLKERNSKNWEYVKVNEKTVL
nr:hypothetical protein [uncultured Flavobacterium sp.]